MSELARKIHRDREEIQAFFEHHDRVHLICTEFVGQMMLTYFDEEGLQVTDVCVEDVEVKTSSWMGVPLFDGTVMPEEGVFLAMSDLPQMSKMLDYIESGTDMSHVYAQHIYSGTSSVELMDYAWREKKTVEPAFFESYSTLNTLGRQSHTDKSDTLHNYLRKYDFFLNQFREREMTVLELGVLRGASLAMWEKYFTKAHIVGVDIDPECSRFENDRTHIMIRDLGREENLQELTELQPTIVIDDASHITSHQIKSLWNLLPVVQPGGVFIMEDLGTNFRRFRTRIYQDASVSCYEFLSEIAKAVTSGEYLQETEMNPGCVPLKAEIECLADYIEMITFINESCIIVRK